MPTGNNWGGLWKTNYIKNSDWIKINVIIYVKLLTVFQPITPEGLGWITSAWDGIQLTRGN